MNPALLAAFAVLALSGMARAETVADRKGAILQDRASLEYDPRWIYDDYERGFAEARRTGKPLLVVLRCIPCLACAGIDAKVVVENSELAPLLDQFVCVRVVNANALDLARFQFDFDLSFTVMFFNGDGTVYGRYGSWTHQKNPRDETIEGFRRTLEKTLELHAAHPVNRFALEGKQGRPLPYATPVDLPTLRGKYTRNLDWENEVVASCVHCHQIGDALRAAHRERNERLPAQLIYPFPGPEAVGLELAPDHAARVNSVTAGSPAARSGLRAGDDLVKLDGQPLVSIADVSWVLHHAPDAGTLPLEIQRGRERLTTRLELPAGWRSRSDISRRVGTWEMRAMVLGGLQLEDLPEEERRARSLPADRLALRVKHVGEYGRHAAAKKAGFRKDDVLVEVAGSTTRETESALIGRLFAQHRPGDSIKVVVLRGNEHFDLALPMQ